MGPVSLPPGFRFHPTDEELVEYYLKRRVGRQEIELEVIPVIDLYKFDPWELPDKSFLPRRDLQWFFFCPRDKKYPNGSRTNRATGSGYWKATGKDRRIICQSVMALRKTLVFHHGRAPAGCRTDWVMYEYRLYEESFEGLTSFVGDFALCHVVKRNEHGQKKGDSQVDSRGKRSTCFETGDLSPRKCMGQNTNAFEGSPPDSIGSNRSHDSVLVTSPHEDGSTTQMEPIMDFRVKESVGSSLLIGNEFQIPSMGFPCYNTIDFSLATPSVDLTAEPHFMMPCPSAMGSMLLSSDQGSAEFQSIQWDESRNNALINGMDSWNYMLSPPICRQASGDGGELGNVWLDDSATVR